MTIDARGLGIAIELDIIARSMKLKPWEMM